MITAQSTTTGRSQINVAQQQRWYYLIQEELAYKATVNQPEIDFKLVRADFQLNVDELCFICDDGILKILGDKGKNIMIKQIVTTECQSLL